MEEYISPLFALLFRFEVEIEHAITKAILLNYLDLFCCFNEQPQESVCMACAQKRYTGISFAILSYAPVGAIVIFCGSCVHSDCYPFIKRCATHTKKN